MVDDIPETGPAAPIRVGVPLPAHPRQRTTRGTELHNRAKWNSEHPSISEHFGSNSTLLYSYSDFEAADTVLISGANSYETGTVFYNRIQAAKGKLVVIDPRRTVPAENAISGGGVHRSFARGPMSCWSTR